MTHCIKNYYIHWFYEDICEDNEDADPDYNVSNDSEDSDNESNTSVISRTCSNENEKSTENEKSNENTTISSFDTSNQTHEGKETCDDTNLIVYKSQKKGANKKYFCMYCKKLQTKFARHLETTHKNEADVKKFILLPKGIINIIIYIRKLFLIKCYIYIPLLNKFF